MKSMLQRSKVMGLVKKGKGAEAMAEAEKLLSINPLDGDNIDAAVKAAEAAGKPEAAAISVEAAYSGNQGDANLLERIATYYMMAKNYAKARDAYDRLSKLKPGGTLIVSTPYKEQIAYSLCIHCNRKTPHNAHLHSFDEEKVRRMVAPLHAEIKGIRLVGNKLLLRTHLSVLLSHLGMPVWKSCDRIANSLIHKANHFIITITKS
jgi:tetratricopeptide (TPR) repeat protein